MIKKKKKIPLCRPRISWEDAAENVISKRKCISWTGIQQGKIREVFVKAQVLQGTLSWEKEENIKQNVILSWSQQSWISYFQLNRIIFLINISHA